MYEEIRTLENAPGAADYSHFRKVIEQDIALSLGIERDGHSAIEIDNFSQLNFCDVAFQIIDNNKTNVKRLQAVLDMANLIWKYASRQNGTIVIFCEYLQEEIRRAEKNPKAADYSHFRKEIEQDIARELMIKRPISIMKYNSINQIVSELDVIVEQADDSALDAVGSKIVGCTIAVEGIEVFYSKYTILEEIAELGADLEAEKDHKHQKAIFAIIKQKLRQLKELGNA